MRHLTLAILIAVAAVSGAEAAPPRFLEGPTLVQNPNKAVPLAAVLSFKASEPVETTAELFDGERR